MKSFAELGINIVIGEAIEVRVNHLPILEIIIVNGRYEFDWIAVAKYIMHKYINCKAMFTNLKEYFDTDLIAFDYLPRAETNFEFHSKENSSLSIKLKESDVRSASIFVRLLYASQELSQNPEIIMFISDVEIEQALSTKLKKLCKHMDERTLEATIADQVWRLCVELVSMNQPIGERMVISELVNR